MTTNDSIRDKQDFIRNSLRMFTDFEQYCADTGLFEVSSNGHTVNFLDLQGILKDLPDDQQQAINLCVIRDQRQQDAVKPLRVKNEAAVTALVNRGLATIAARYFPEHSL